MPFNDINDYEIDKVISKYIPQNDNSFFNVRNVFNRFFKLMHSQNKKSRSISLKALSIIVIFSITCIYLPMMAQNTFSVSSEDIKDLKSQAHIVATCENKTIHKVYADLRKKYDYKSMNALTFFKYKRVMKDLGERNCSTADTTNRIEKNK